MLHTGDLSNMHTIILESLNQALKELLHHSLHKHRLIGAGDTLLSQMSVDRDTSHKSCYYNLV